MSKNHDQKSETPLTLSGRHRELLSDLMIEVQRLGSGASAEMIRQAFSSLVHQSDARQEALTSLLNRALADAAYLALWLEAVHQALPNLLPYEELADETIDQVVKKGVEQFNPGQAAFLALSPDQLSVIQDEILEQMPWGWVERVETAMTQAAHESGEYRRTAKELLEEVLEQVTPSIKEKERSEDFSSAFAMALGAKSSEEETPPPQSVSEPIRADLVIKAKTGHWENTLKEINFTLAGKLIKSDMGIQVKLCEAPIGDLSAISWKAEIQVKASVDAIQLTNPFELPIRLLGERNDQYGQLVVELNIRKE